MNHDTYAEFGIEAHDGLDWTGPIRGVPVPVYSPFDARVMTVGDQKDKGYGKYIRLLTDPGADGTHREIVLGHFADIYVKQGQRVSLGNPVGLMGKSGFATGIHLHVGLRYRDLRMNILNYGNGFFGYQDFEQYVLYWKRDKSGMVTIV